MLTSDRDGADIYGWICAIMIAVAYLIQVCRLLAGQFKDLTALLDEATYLTKLAKVHELKGARGSVVLRLHEGSLPEVTKVSESMLKMTGKHTKQGVNTTLHEDSTLDAVRQRCQDIRAEIGQTLFEFPHSLQTNEGAVEVSVHALYFGDQEVLLWVSAREDPREESQLANQESPGI